MRPLLMCSVLVLPLASPLVEQEPVTPMITDVRHVRWLWKAQFELAAPAHVVIVDWHPELGVERRYPRRGFATRPFDAGRHTVPGDVGRTRRHGPRVGTAVSQGTVSVMSMTGIGWSPLSVASLDFNATTLGVVATRESAAPSTRYPASLNIPWRAFVLTLPHPVSAAEVDSTLREVELRGDAEADIAALAAALGAGSWGGQTPHMRRRYGL